MATSSVNSFMNSYGIKNTGIGGLASGLNTEEIVEALTYGTRAKIAKQGQSRQLLVWKQSAYRSVRTTLSNFQTQNLSQTNMATNIMRPDFFNTFKGVSSSNKVTLDSAKTNKTGSVTIDKIHQLATSQQIRVDVDPTVLPGLTGDGDKELDYTDPTLSFYGKTLSFSINDGTMKTVRLDGLDHAKTRTDADYAKLAHDDPLYLLALQSVRPTYTTSTPPAPPTTISPALNPQERYQIEMQYIFDKSVGTQTVLDSTGQPDPDPAGGYKQESIVKVSLVAGPTPGKHVFNLESQNTRITIQRDCDVLGFTTDQTNKVSMKATIAEVFGVSGDEFTFKVNNATITVQSTDTIKSLMDKITNTATGARLEYSVRDDQFIWTAEATGAGSTLVVEDIKGNLMQVFVGAKGSTSLTSNPIPNGTLGYDDSITSDDAVELQDLIDLLENTKSTNGSISIRVTYRGQDFDLIIDADDIPEKTSNNRYGGTTADRWLANTLNTALNEAISEEFDDYSDFDIFFNFTIDKTVTPNEYTFELNGPATEEFGWDICTTATNANNTDMFSVFTITTTDNDNNPPTLLSAIFTDPSGVFMIQDWHGNMQYIEWGTPPGTITDLRQFLAALNTAFGASDDSFATFDPSTNRITLNAGDGAYALYLDETADPTYVDPVTGVAYNIGGDALDFLFGFANYDGLPILDDGSQNFHYITGKNAEIIIDGQVHHSSTNTFVIDGIGFTVSDTTDGTPAERITITSQSDTEELMDKLHNFVEEYNAIIQSLNKLLFENKASGYEPLTDEQKAEMSETQIKEWENEAKKGLLRNDTIIRAIVDGLRTAVYTEVKAAGISLYEIGIDIASYSSNSSGEGYNLEKAGILKIDENKLRSSIEQNPDAIRVLFTNSTKGDQGIAYLINDEINKAVNGSSTARGTLVTVAGLESDPTALQGQSELGRKIDSIDKYITTLRQRLEMEYSRHCKKFSALEVAIQKMNAQSSWLMDFGS